MIFRKLSLLALILIITIKPAQAKSVADSMEDFWQNSGGSYGNGTDAQSYQIQGAGYYAGGGFRGRAKVIDVHPLTITPPGIRAGCGGIDIYTGSFSYANTDQYLAVAKAIPANALGFAFDLALETISPAIKGTMDKIQSVINQINNMNLNSCDMAQNLVSSGLKYSGFSQKYCEVSANSKGYSTDFARAKNECGTGGKSATYNKQADAVNGDNRLHDINVAWEVLKKSQVVNSGNDDNLAEFIQALTGTVIIKSPTNDGSGPEISYKPNILVNEDTIRAMLDGGQVQILSCDEKDKCLNPISQTINLSADKAFRARVVKILDEISSKISSNSAFGVVHKDLINTTSIPIYKAILVHQTYYKSSSAISSNLNLYSSLIAIDILYNYLDQILKQVEEQSKQVQNFDQDNVEKFKKQVGAARLELSKYKVDQKQSFDEVQKLTKETMDIEAKLTSRLSAKMKTNLLWSSKF
jgi:conjugative transfer pilus assembly protein TraH